MIDWSLINIQLKAVIIYLILSIRYDRKSKILVTTSYLYYEYFKASDRNTIEIF